MLVLFRIFILKLFQINKTIYMKITKIHITTFNNIPSISWRSALLLKETRMLDDNHTPAKVTILCGI